MHILIILLIILSAACSAFAAADPANTCAAAKLTAVGKQVDSLLTCHARAVKAGVAVDPECLRKTEDAFTLAFTKAEDTAVKQGGQCLTVGNVATIKERIDTIIGEMVTAFRPTPIASACAAAKLIATGNATLSLLQAYARNLVTPNNKALETAVSQVQANLAKAFTNAETLKKGNCLTLGDGAAIREIVDGLAQSTLTEEKAVGSLVFKKQKVIGLPAPVTLNGKILVSQDGDFVGQVVAEYGQDGSATIIATGATMVIQVGAHTVELLLKEQNAIALDGVNGSKDQAFEMFRIDIESGLDPTQWSAISQATLVLAALVSTEVWQANLQVVRTLEASGLPQTTAPPVEILAAVSGQAKLDMCNFTAYLYAALSMASDYAACFSAGAACAAAPSNPVTVLGIPLLCSQAALACGRAFGGSITNILSGSFRNDAVYNICTGKCGFHLVGTSFPYIIYGNCGVDFNFCNEVQECNHQTRTCEPNPDHPAVVCTGVGEQCNPKSGLCERPNCADDNLCTTDTYNPEVGCVNTPKTCAAGTVCNPSTGSCDPPCVSDPTICVSLDLCSTSTCNPSGAGADTNGCVSTPKTCPSGTLCNPSTGSCDAPCVLLPALCNSSDFCNPSTCSPGGDRADANGCVSTPKTCDPGLQCDPSDGVCKGSCDHCLPYCYPAPPPQEGCLDTRCCAVFHEGASELCVVDLVDESCPPDTWFGGACRSLIEGFGFHRC